MTSSLAVHLRVSREFLPRAEYVLNTLLSPYDVSWKRGRDLELTEDELRPAFANLARVEEWESETRDPHGRFPLHAGKGLTDPPPLSVMSAAIAREFGLRRRPWPGGAKFVVALTHDVDRLQNLHREEVPGILNRAAWHFLKKVNPVKGFRDITEIVWRGLSPNRNWNFDEICREESTRGFRSSWYFSTGHYTSHDNYYDPASRRVRERIVRLQESGHEVGLHRSIDRSHIEHETRALSEVTGRPVRGNRCHYLALDVRRDFKAFEQCGYQYDTSLGYPEQEGFRGGWSFPYRPYDLRNEKPYDIVEVPLALMDTTLIHHRKLTPDEGWKAALRILDRLEKSGGAAAILWHNGRTGCWQKLYFRILDEIRNRGGAGMPAASLVDSWNTA